MTLTACQSIHRLPETFHVQCVAVIVGVFIWQCMVFVLRKHWSWLINGGGLWGHYHGRKLGPYQRLAAGVVGSFSWVVDGRDRLYYLLYMLIYNYKFINRVP